MQSSSATTVIVVGLVNGGLLTFKHSLGVIVGANVGTTITAQLVAYRLETLAPILLVIGFALGSFKNRYKFLGKPIFYLGFLLFVVSLLSAAVQPFKTNPQVIQAITMFDNPLFGILIGALITALFQSSSVTSSIVVLMGSEGLLGINAAIPIIIGANIGTTSTALLASYYKGDVFAKRTARGHLIFNLGGALVFLPLIPVLARIVTNIGGNSGIMIANAHTIFNITSALLFLFILGPVEKFIIRTTPSRETEIIFKPKYLDKIPNDTKKALSAVKKELIHQMEILCEITHLSVRMLTAGTLKNAHRVSKLESLNDFLDDRISLVLIELSKRELTPKEAREVYVLSRISNELEQAGDMGEEFTELAQNISERGLRLLPETSEQLEYIEHELHKNISQLMSEIDSLDQKTLRKMDLRINRIERSIHSAYKQHIKRLARRKTDFFAGTAFVDALAELENCSITLRRVAKHFYNLKKKNNNNDNPPHRRHKRK